MKSPEIPSDDLDNNSEQAPQDTGPVLDAREVRIQKETDQQTEKIASEHDQKELEYARREAKTGFKEGGEGIMREAVGKKIQGIMNESRLPSEDYKSTVGVYGGKMDVDKDGHMVWGRRGIISKVDKAGDAVLRTYDEHVVKEPYKLMRRHPRLFLKSLFAPGTKRYRGNNEEIVENIERLGLSDYYGPHENGIEIKKPEVYTRGVALQDVYRADEIDSEKLQEIDRFQALAEASKYVRQIHDEHGGIGELLVSDIIFQEDENGKLGKPVLNLPDIVFNKKKITGEIDKKTTDMLDFAGSVFGEEYKKSKNLEDVDRALDTIMENYGDSNTIAMIESFIKRGRLTLEGDTKAVNLPDTITRAIRGLFSQHNKARLSAEKETDSLMKEKIMAACERFLEKQETE